MIDCLTHKTFKYNIATKTIYSMQWTMGNIDSNRYQIVRRYMVEGFATVCNFSLSLCHIISDVATELNTSSSGRLIKAICRCLETQCILVIKDGGQH